MALAKDRKPYDSQMGLLQPSTYYGNVFGMSSSSAQLSDQSSPELYLFDDHPHKAVVPPTEDGETSEKTNALVMIKNLAMSRSSSLSSSNGYVYQPEEAHSVIDFKTAGNNNSFVHNSSTGSFLSFEQNDQQDDYSIWEDNLIHGYQHDHDHHHHHHHNQLNDPKCSTSNSGRLLQDFNCVQSAASSYGGGMGSASAMKENPHGGEPFGKSNSEANATIGAIQELGTQEACFNKRPHKGESMQALKRQCSSGATRKPKPKSTPSKDPQSIAAKNRRERISERLKVLQDLVPNGSKVDLVTMLEKAISYVKFLQLQVKVLATDEFWPVQGGKAPDISQVKEAIEAILSSQKDRNSRLK